MIGNDNLWNNIVGLGFICTSLVARIRIPKRYFNFVFSTRIRSNSAEIEMQIDINYYKSFVDVLDNFNCIKA